MNNDIGNQLKDFLKVIKTWRSFKEKNMCELEDVQTLKSV